MKQVTIALIGAGLRGQIYTDYALDHPGELQLVAVADPNGVRREKLRSKHGIEERKSWADWREMLSQPKLADAVVICTQDNMHYEPAMKALEMGYDVLLEKPMSPDPLECVKLGEAAERYGRVFSICHVLRYTNFFGTIKRMLDEGAIGRLLSVQHNENVGYWHQAHSFVRGNWRNSAESSPMILAKSCHDMDILLWLAGADCIRLSSNGSLSYFKEENAPAGAPKRCTDGCPVADDCLYYAPRVYVTETGEPGWMSRAVSDDTSPEGIIKALKEGPYGRCVYHCDNDVVDHQVVNLAFANEVTAVFTMSAFTKACDRTIKLMGTEGEIRGAMEKNEIEWIRFDKPESEILTLETPGGHVGHGGGDYGLMRDFVRLVGSGGAVEGATSAAKSVQSHLMAFAAERSRLENRVVELKEFAESVGLPS